MSAFDHERLDVYQAAIQLVVLADDLIQHAKGGVLSWLTNSSGQRLRLLSTLPSAPARQQEGTGALLPNRLPIRTECAAILDVCKSLKLVPESTTSGARDLLVRIVSMLTRMSSKLQRDGHDESEWQRRDAGTGTGTGTGTNGPPELF